jgi:hypothetical protein
MLTLRASQKLQVLLAGAVSATEGPMTADYEEGTDAERAVPKTAQSISTGATAVDLVTGIAEGRKIKGFSFYNADSASVVVTVRFYDNGTTRILRKCTLLTLEGLHWDPAQGWYAVDANGNRKGNSASTDTAVSSQGSSIAAAVIPASVNSVSSQASSIALAVLPASVNSVSSQASSIALAVIPASINSISSQASSIALAVIPASINSISALQSGASAQSFTSTTWSTVSSATSRVKSSFTW